ncbi:MAG: OmpA family protein [Saprospiraceae bacterium]|nr:OmpA family protein [Saprospiraceae bacterium]
MRLPIVVVVCSLMLSACVSKKKFLNEVAEKEGFRKVAVELTNNLQREKTKVSHWISKNMVLRDSLWGVQTDLAAFARQNKVLVQAVNALTEEMTTLKQRYDIAVQEEQLSSEKRDQAIRQMQQEANFKTQIMKELYAKLEAALQPYATSVTLQRLEQEVLIGFPHSFLFSSNNRLSESGVMALTQVGEILKTQRLVDVTVVGHVEKNASKSVDAWATAYQLASTASKALVNQLSAKNLTVASKGDSEPIANNDTKMGKAQNRRIVLLIQPRLEEWYQFMQRSRQE